MDKSTTFADMITELSILLPTYNNTCFDMVETLQRQAASIEGLDFEILVADDGSTNMDAIESNRRINQLGHCKLMECNVNRGRSRIRNFLAEMAQYEWLLFLDSDVGICEGFVQKYVNVDARASVYCGGITIPHVAPQWADNLRYRYKQAFLRKNTIETANHDPYKSFRSANFMARQSVMSAHKFNMNIKTYGYEDVLLGKDLQQDGIPTVHINNPVVIDHFEDNASFLKKTAISCQTLFMFRNELKGYSSLLHLVELLHEVHATPLAAWFFRRSRERIERRLSGKKPSVKLFQLFRIGCLVMQFEKK